MKRETSVESGTCGVQLRQIATLGPEARGRAKHFLAPLVRVTPQMLVQCFANQLTHRSTGSQA